MQNKTHIFALVYNDRLQYNVTKSSLKHHVALALQMYLGTCQHLKCRTQ